VSTTLLTSLRRANAEVGRFLVKPAALGSSPRTHPAIRTRLEALAERLEQVARQLPPRPTVSQLDPETQAEVNQYVKNLGQLQTNLENLQATLLESRNRLETERVHFRAARAWVSAVKENG